MRPHFDKGYFLGKILKGGKNVDFLRCPVRLFSGCDIWVMNGALRAIVTLPEGTEHQKRKKKEGGKNLGIRVHRRMPGLQRGAGAPPYPPVWPFFAPATGVVALGKVHTIVMVISWASSNQLFWSLTLLGMSRLPSNLPRRRNSPGFPVGSRSRPYHFCM